MNYSKPVLAMTLLLAALVLSSEVSAREISETTLDVKPGESTIGREGLHEGGWGGHGHGHGHHGGGSWGGHGDHGDHHGSGSWGGHGDHGGHHGGGSWGGHGHHGGHHGGGKADKEAATNP